MDSDNTHNQTFSITHLRQSYLLRLWREEPNGPLRIQLLDVASDQRQGFPNLEKLLAYLSTQSVVTDRHE